jgi:type IV secretory pathway VirJ component
MRATLLVLSLICSALLCAPVHAQALSHGRFKDMTIYKPQGPVRQLVLFLSGSEGWNATTALLAQALTDEGALVAGIDLQTFFADLERDGGSCVFPDGDLENLSHFLQAYFRLPTYQPPVLVGYGTGATFVYAMLAQAPADVFAGGISLAFCEELKLGKPLCRGEAVTFAPRADHKSVQLTPAERLGAPWTALQGQSDKVCSAAAAQRFIVRSRDGEVLSLPGIVHGSAQADAWIPQMKAALQRLMVRQAPAALGAPTELDDLPIVEVAATGSSDMLAVLISGDGGWAGIDKEVAAALAAEGIPVVGLDSLRYFWTERTPQSTAADVDRILRYYLKTWKKQRALLIGYSQGADVLPFVINRLPRETRARVQLAVMMSPGVNALFEFHLSNWLAADAEGLPIRPEAVKITSPPRLVCMYGEDEDDDDTLCPTLPANAARVLKLPGGHHFDGDYDELAELILQQAKQSRTKQP